MGRLCWKKEPRPTGLMGVGAGPYRTSWLRDGDTRIASVSPVGGDWRGPLTGWYFCAGWDSTIPTKNSYSENQNYPDEKSAKAAARKYVEEHLNAKN